MASEVAAHKLWGFSGFSGQMFFNMLVSSADPEDDTNLAALLRVRTFRVWDKSFYENLNELPKS